MFYEESPMGMGFSDAFDHSFEPAKDATYVPNFVEVPQAEPAAQPVPEQRPAAPRRFTRPEHFAQAPPQLYPKMPLHDVFLRADRIVPLDHVANLLVRIFNRDPAEVPYMIDDFVHRGEVWAGRYTFEIADHKAHLVQYDIPRDRSFGPNCCKAFVTPARQDGPGF